MAYRNGTYVAFHANKTKQPTESDIKYLKLLRAWKVRSDGDFKFIDSHGKQAAVWDTSKRATLEHSLKRCLRDSKIMVLVIGETTKEDTDWVPFEIRIDDGRARVIHVPFRQEPLANAISQFSYARYPKGGGLGRYSAEAYRSWGIT